MRFAFGVLNPFRRMANASEIIAAPRRLAATRRMS